VKYVLFYESGENVAVKAPEHFPAHQRWLTEYHERGELLMVGTFADPQAQGSMAIFSTRDAAEAFVAGDPFVEYGVVKAHEIREWVEILT
jgi:uncharacterized protein YciI